MKLNVHSLACKYNVRPSFCGREMLGRGWQEWDVWVMCVCVCVCTQATHTTHPPRWDAEVQNAATHTHAIWKKCRVE